MPVKRRRRLSASSGYAYGERAASVRSMRRLSAACGYAYGVCAADTYRMMQHAAAAEQQWSADVRSRFPLASLALSARIARIFRSRSPRSRNALASSTRVVGFSMMLSVL